MTKTRLFTPQSRLVHHTVDSSNQYVEESCSFAGFGHTARFHLSIWFESFCLPAVIRQNPVSLDMEPILLSSLLFAKFMRAHCKDQSISARRSDRLNDLVALMRPESYATEQQVHHSLSDVSCFTLRHLYTSTNVNKKVVYFYTRSLLSCEPAARSMRNVLICFTSIYCYQT